VVIVSSDKDMLQLVTDRVTMLNPAKDDEWYDAAKVLEFTGVRPDQVADLLALKGDAVDNIPGAPGIGDKGARELIAQFGSGDAEELRTWLAAAQGAPVAVAILKSGEGEFALDTVGLAWQPGEARAVNADRLADLKPWLEDPAAVKIACDVKRALLALSRLGIDARGFEHDVMLYAFLLDAEPAGCPLDEQARRRLDLKLGASPEQHADITLE